RHCEGGIKLLVIESGGGAVYHGEMEGGEFIVSKTVAGLYTTVLTKIINIPSVPIEIESIPEQVFPEVINCTIPGREFILLIENGQAIISRSSTMRFLPTLIKLNSMHKKYVFDFELNLPDLYDENGGLLDPPRKYYPRSK